MMNTETDYLRSIAVEIAAKPNKNEDGLLPDKHLSAEAFRLKRNITTHLLAIDNFPQRESFYFNTLTKLIEICDILYSGTNSVSPDVQVIMALVKDVTITIPTEISPRLQLAKAFISLQSEVMLSSIKTYSDILKEQGVEQKLINIAMIPFKQFAQPIRKLYWRNLTWLKGYEEKLDTIDWENADCGSNTEALMSVLLNCDFNDDRFFIYCKRYITGRAERYGTKKRKLAEFVLCETLIKQDTLGEFPSYNHRWPNISNKLLDWINIASAAIKANDSFDDEIYKIEFNLDIDSLALFWKYLMDHGITKLVPVDLYAKQIAATCSTKGKEEFKWESIKSKFYGKAAKYLRRIFDPMVEIIEAMKPFLRA